MHCGDREQLQFFSVRRGGMFCPKCKSGQGAVAISESARYTVQYVISATVEKLYTFRVSDEVLEELKGIMKEFLSYYVKHTFKSLQILEEGDVFF
jgi:DNA repair protein RecO (recombination protein O)